MSVTASGNWESNDIPQEEIRENGAAIRGSPKTGRPQASIEWQKVPGLDVEPYKQRNRIEEEKMEEIQAQIRKLTTEIKARGGNREEFERKRTAIRQELDELAKRIEALEKERNTMFGQIDDRQRQGREKRNEMMKEISQIGFSSEEEIKSKIASIQSDMMRNKNLSIHEEKRLMDQIGQLRKKIPQVSKFAAVEASVGSGEKEVVPLKGRIEDVKKELFQLKDERRAKNEILRNLQEERKNALSPVNELYEQKDALRKELEEINIRRHEIKMEYREEFKKFQAKNAKKRTEQRAQQQAEKRIQQVEQQIEQVRQKLDTIDEFPFSHEINRLGLLIKYTKSFVKSEGEESPVTKPSEVDTSDGKILPKSQRGDDGMIPQKSKKRQSRGKTSGSITHTVEMLNDYNKFGVTAPLMIENVESCIEELTKIMEAKKEEQMKEHGNKKSTRDQWEKELQELQQRLVEVTVTGGSPPAKASDKSP